MRMNSHKGSTCVCKPLLLHLHPKKSLRTGSVTFYPDNPVGFMMQATIAEGRVILSKFWHTLRPVIIQVRKTKVYSSRRGKLCFMIFSDIHNVC